MRRPMALVNVVMVGFTPRQDHFRDDINLGEGFEEGSPDGHDPLIIARHMASKGVTLVSSQLLSGTTLRQSMRDSSLWPASQH